MSSCHDPHLDSLVVEHYANGLSRQQTAMIVGLSIPTVTKILRQNGVSPTRRPRRGLYAPTLSRLGESRNAIQQQYESGATLDDLAVAYATSAYTIRRFLISSGVTIRRGNLKHKTKTDYFDVIDSQNKAYTLGIMFSDGTNNGAGMVLSMTDRDIVCFVADQIGGASVRTKTFQNPAHNPQYVFAAHGQYLSRSLSRTGCVPKKSLVLEPPRGVPDHLIRHFIRGYFDGDGHIGWNKGSPYLNMLGTAAFLTWVDAAMPCSGSIRLHSRNGNIHGLYFYGRVKIRAIYEYLYDGASIWMDRKRAIFTRDK